MKQTNIQICLSIFGESFNIEELSKVLNIDPTDSGNKGEKIQNFSSDILRKETTWDYMVGPVDTYDIDDLLNIIINKFTDKINIINDFVRENDLLVKIFIVPIIEEETPPALYFNKDFIELVYKLGAEIDIDLYVN